MHNIIIVGVAIITAVLSQLLFKKGMMTMGGEVSISANGIFQMILNTFRNPYILIGIFLYGISFIVWLIVLSRLKLSFVYPITSLNFVLVILASYHIFGEQLSATQLCAVAIIITGVIMLSNS